MEISDDDPAETVELFDWLPVAALAIGRGLLTRQESSVALFIALSTHGTSGRDGTIDAARLATELGRSERQVWRIVGALVDKGWITRTAPPVRGQRGKRGSGRRARYGLTLPRLDLSFDTGPVGLTLPSVHDD